MTKYGKYCPLCGAAGVALPGEQWLVCDPPCHTFWPNPDAPAHDFGFNDPLDGIPDEEMNRKSEAFKAFDEFMSRLIPGGRAFEFRDDECDPRTMRYLSDPKPRK